MNKAILLRVGEDLAAAALGAAITWVIVDYFRRKAVEEVYRDTEKLRRTYKKETAKAQATINEYVKLVATTVKVEDEGSSVGFVLPEKIPSPEEMSDLMDILEPEGYVAHEEEVEELMSVQDVEERAVDPFFLNRDRNFPYVVTVEEFEQSDCDPISITYYEGDDVLADDKENRMEDQEHYVGDALSRFGDHSGSPDLVFVINESLDAAFEITRVEGTYSHHVLGFKHSYEDEDRRGNRRRVYKMRDDD